MYKQNKMLKSKLKKTSSTTGESIEDKVRRIVNNKEPIKDGAPLIYTERKEGVIPAYDIRTDVMEIAVDAMGAVAKQAIATRKNKIDNLGKEAKENMEKEAKSQSTDGTKSETDSSK